MSDFRALAESPIAGAIGWAVIHSLWEGAVISAALGGIFVVTRSPRVRYLAATGALLFLLGAFCLTSFFYLPQIEYRSAASEFRVSAAWSVAADFPVRSGWSPTLDKIAPWLAPFWLVGVCVFFVRNLTNWLSVQRLRHRGVCGVPERWLTTLARLRDRVGVRRQVELLESCFAEAPVVLGHLRPLILMPVGLFTGLPVNQIETILLHELVHIRRFDYLSNLVQRAIEALLFYHPAVWWISRTIRTEREHCCDDAVVALSGDVHEYATALAALEENRRTEREPAVAATGGNLVNRIHRLLYSNRASGPTSPVFAGVVLIATAAIAAAAWKPLPPRPTAANLQQQAGQAENSSNRWLSEDVVYIITDAERAAFERLSTSEERDKFIEQFWSRRNPSPSAAVNEFKQEHYRRLAFANAHFQTASGEPGWKTDRGHIYIVYGPPDEIDAHPNGGEKMKQPYQDWGFRRVDGIGDNLSFTFVDATGRGDYRLAPSAAR